MDWSASEPRKRRRIKWWWNFAGRTDDEIRKVREDWMTPDRFGEVKGYDGARLDTGKGPDPHVLLSDAPGQGGHGRMEGLRRRTVRRPGLARASAPAGTGPDVLTRGAPDRLPTARRRGRRQPGDL
ncbi:hypothetical protein ACFUGD_03935 [Streptomyces sp. NPDC057217]|uniref:hypothetical protein n=1 Tax=Streptomyces sp. NPDC057217 TaxID=3346054 RepID=UPI0036405218